MANNIAQPGGVIGGPFDLHNLSDEVEELCLALQSHYLVISVSSAPWRLLLHALTKVVFSLMKLAFITFLLRLMTLSVLRKTA